MISVQLPGDEIGKRFSVGGRQIGFWTQAAPSENRLRYEFLVDGKRIRLSEVALSGLSAGCVTEQGAGFDFY
ncbi:hypothetical protein WL80_10815 [Burkholderia ubonensis]|uniref:hypothetical protein n=1 Tax=Burkholderia ubonensis TaxID=101571 RepID=UPI00075E9288|nr:hypothetical protein [Burkholderia ubonensis]KVT46376.1 hypothetical protein WK51_02300 [Burkholderia ubonensis]KWE93367.1 hypothetical protein WL80_10815 [Burkholderia ubonensis]